MSKKTMISSAALMESRSLREAHIDRVEVLDKVKKLALLPNDVHTTVGLVANYYEVSKKTIEKIIERHRLEVESDGLKVLRGKELTDMKSVGLIGKRTASFVVVPRRAVLRIGMTLEKSEVAKAVRDYLLDAEEQTNHRKAFNTEGMSEDEQFELAKMAFDNWTKERQLRKQVEESNKMMAPKAEVYDALVDTNTTMSLRDVAKLIGAKPNKMNEFLRESGILFKNIRGDMRPYQTYMNKGWFEVKEMTINGRICLQTRVTQKGVVGIRTFVLDAETRNLLVGGVAK
ncbi:phage antirepressor KilAC domain-containing protein [Mechercharimyces sp. CAU 1602]|uniref:phage antirepressor KilAC domain-containing protein n=1 Tax=Mechercharimyces sp. CAU 1602 TaxID=2973933 RepID=UPI002161FEB4|nr:phage antirepressor KilAC domain-containing protein [Mechercharimyces sp. CAU 1602]MCS1350345.1 phage antirepressor KilAC domain-containing protein [Mechercharimyces sp. CAU 1602]